MAKTFNRSPKINNTPSSNDLKILNFTQTFWKGVISDKNFLEVDQNSFSDAKNVYVDKEGLLRSRPSIKPCTIKVNNEELLNIIDAFDFGVVKVYKISNDDEYDLIFVNNDKYVTLKNVSNDVKLYKYVDKVYVLDVDQWYYYSISEALIEKADNDVYVPVTKIHSGNSVVDNETENELTSAKKERYLFVDKHDDYSNLYNKNIKFKLNDTEYDVPYNEYTPETFLEEKSVLNADNFVTLNGSKKCLISISDKNTLIKSAKVGDVYTIQYSADGINYDDLPSIENILDMPRISKDGNYAYCLKEGNDSTGELYVYSLVNTNIPNQYFTEWTPLFKTLYPTEKPSWNKQGKPTCEMDNINNFAVYYVKYSTDPISYPQRYLDTCINGNFETFEFAEVTKIFPDRDVMYFYDEDFTTPSTASDILTDINGNYAYTLKLERMHTSYTNSVRSCEILASFTLDYNGEVTSYRGWSFTATVTEEKDLTICDDYLTFKLNRETYADGTYGDGYDLTVEINYYSDVQANDIKHSDKNLSYNGNVNIKSSYNGDKATFVIDAGGLYLIEKDADFTVKNLPIDDVEKNDASFNGLYLQNGVIKYTKNINNVVTKEYIYDIFNNTVNTKQYRRKSSKYVTTFVYSSDGVLINNTSLYKNIVVDLLFDCVPISYNNDTLYVITDDKLYNNDFTSIINADVLINGSFKYFLPNCVLNSYNTYLSKDNTLYISNKVSDDCNLYFPKINTQVYNDDITNLHTLSSEEILVFFDKEIYYVKNSEQGYLHNRSNLSLGCKYNSDILTTFDGKYTLFATERGLVAMTYQQFVATSDVSLIYLSDVIHERYREFYDKGPIKLFKYLYWIFCYVVNDTKVLIYDIRNSSWWFTECNNVLNKIYTVDDSLRLLINKSNHKLDTSDDYYYDVINTNGVFKNYDIEWNIESQILHFNDLTSVKNINNMSIISVLDNNNKINFNLYLNCYRKVKNNKDYFLSYKVDTIRTFVKHLNIMKVNQLKYEITYDDEAYEKLPLCISSVNLQYKITRQVR